MVKIYRTVDFAVMPWKNKQGTTTQFLIEPPHAQFPDQPFSWRFSSAPVLSNGEFSKFKGYQRALMVIEGSGLTLNQTLLKPFQAHYFSGDETTYAELTAGPVRDLGLIYDSKQVKAAFEVFHLTEKNTQTLECAHAETLLIYALRGNGKVEEQEMTEGEVAHMDHAGSIRLQSRLHPCVWVGLRIEKTEA